MPLWVLHTYWWLEENNFWKSQVAFWVTIALSAIVGVFLRPWRAWKRHKATQEAIADRLDTQTPGGLADLVAALKQLTHDLDDGEAPDDNGSDPGGREADDDERKRDIRPHGGKGFFPELPQHGGGHGSSVIPDPLHGGGNSAGHR